MTKLTKIISVITFCLFLTLRASPVTTIPTEISKIELPPPWSRVRASPLPLKQSPQLLPVVAEKAKVEVEKVKVEGAIGLEKEKVQLEKARVEGANLRLEMEKLMLGRTWSWRGIEGSGWACFVMKYRPSLPLQMHFLRELVQVDAPLLSPFFNITDSDPCYISGFVQAAQPSPAASAKDSRSSVS
ncbi:hypothetical protein BDZ91DRAFT_768283 [Kalaharituber pfeilii]|nr:hypothetical protein BDZ91DRAFT_768283 [Kalaharituber pfeilii]